MATHQLTVSDWMYGRSPLAMRDALGHAQTLLPLLLGEAPGEPVPAGTLPLSGAVGRRLCQFAGIRPRVAAPEPRDWYEALRERFDCVNVIERREDAYPWRTRLARDRWATYLLAHPNEEQHQTLTVACLGRKAAAAVGLRSGRAWGEWVEAGLLRATVIPHPSGRNRLYNDEAMCDLAGRVLREAME